MGASKTSLSRSRKSLDEMDDSPFEGLVAPAPVNQSGAQQIASAEPMADGGAQVARPMVSSVQLPKDDLSPNQIRDQLGIGGMSPLEIQRRLLSDVFMTDEDRATYQSALHRDPSTPMKLPGLQTGPVSASDALEVFKQVHLPVQPHPDAANGEEYGAIGALAPQGLTAPQGLMAKVGMLAALGLFTPRSDAPGSHGEHRSAEPAGGHAQEASLPKLSAPSSSRASQLGSNGAAHAGTAVHQLSAQADGRAFAPAQAFGDTGKIFEPVAASQGSASSGWLGKSLWQSKGSPFAAIFKAIGTLLLALFGFGHGGHPAHRRARRR